MVPTEAVDDVEDVDFSEDEQSLTSYVRRPQHALRLAEVLRMSGDELRDALTVKKHDQEGYIPSEVLVTLVRSNYGGRSQVRNAIALCLNERLVIELKRFLNRNLQWYRVITRSSEAEVEAVAYTRERIFRSKVDVCFAEVTFGEFVGMRLLDWFKSQIRLKNKVPSVDALKPSEDEDGNALSMVDQVPDEVSLSPQETLERKQLFARCRGAVQLLPEKQRTALTLCELQGMTHKQAALVLGLSESSVQKYVKAALEGLRNGDWYE